MNIGAWNIRGVKGGRKSSSIRRLVRRNSIGILGLVETKHSSITGRKARNIWGNDQVEFCHALAKELSGGIILLYDKGFFKLERTLIKERWIAALGKLGEDVTYCCIVVVYGYNSRLDNLSLWDEMESFLNGIALPTLLMGDFNEVRNQQERRSMGQRNQVFGDFDDWINKMCLIEIQLGGRKFTWCRGGSMSKLDRFLCNTKWLDKFSSSSAIARGRGLSDHNPIILKLSDELNEPKPFRALDMWFSHPSFLKVVKEEWEMLGSMEAHKKLMLIKEPLKRWNKGDFGNFEEKIRCIEDELNDLDITAESRGLSEEEQQL